MMPSYGRAEPLQGPREAVLAETVLWHHPRGRIRPCVRNQVESFIRSAGRDGSFEELALALFAYQYERVPLYRALCEARHASPRDVVDWRQVPALPVEAFKHGLVAESARPFVFVSSGTSQGGQMRSRLALSTLATYRISVSGHFASMVLPDEPGPMNVLVLGPTASSHTNSSLGAMFSWIAEAVSQGEPAVAFDERGVVAVAEAIDWLRRAAEDVRPVLILAVSSALTAVLDEIRHRDLGLRLPAHSRIVDTGGTKAYSDPGAKARTLSARGLLKAAWRYLHVPAYMCVNEYGMTEMLSQFYDNALANRVRGKLGPRAKVGPPWTRTTIVDPTTLEPVPAGQKGLLRHFDLANWESVAALQTLDVGRAVGAGFEVLGRAEGAERRGCSELLAGVVSQRACVEDR